MKVSRALMELSTTCKALMDLHPLHLVSCNTSLAPVVIVYTIIVTLQRLHLRLHLHLHSAFQLVALVLNCFVDRVE